MERQLWREHVDGLYKFKWQERVIAVEKFHKMQCREDEKWTLRDTARELRRSVGRISEDLQLAKNLPVYPRLTTFSTVQDALDYIRNIKRKIRLGEV